MGYDGIGADARLHMDGDDPDAFDGDVVLVHGIFSSASAWNPLRRGVQAEPVLRHVNFRTFEYESPRFRFPLARTRIPDYDDIADSLRSFLRLEDDATPPLAIVTHSQGGLIVQRFLASTVERGRARELARIRFVMLLACPNEGSEYLSFPRRFFGFGLHPQARDLHPMKEDVRKSRQMVLSSIVNANTISDRSCPIPISAYVGRTDNIVRAASAKGVFEDTRTIPGDHSSILDPTYPGSLIVSELSSLIQRHAGRHRGRARSKAPSVRHDINSLPPDIPDFSGRASEVRDLVALLGGSSGSGRGPLVNVFGKPGAGKSALAVHAAWLVGDHFPDGRLHVDLRGQHGDPQDSDELVSRLLAELDSQGAGERDRRTPARQLQELARDKRMLIVLDNARDASQVRAVAAATPSCGIVVTSRSPLSWLEGVHSCPIDAVSPTDGLHLLRAVSHRPDGEDDAMVEIVSLCGALPLALRIAGAQLKSRPQAPASLVAARLRGERERIRRLHSGDLDVASSFSLSFTELSDPDSTTLRRMARANVSTYDVTLVSLLMGCSIADAEDRLDKLVTAQLVDEVQLDRYSLHDLVRLFASEIPTATSVSDVEDDAMRAAVSAASVLSYVDALGRTSGFGFTWPSSESRSGFLAPEIHWRFSQLRSNNVHESRGGLFGSENAIILGDPGAGKTAAALAHVHQLAGRRADGDFAMVPFYLPLREWRPGNMVSVLAATTRSRFGVEMPADVVRDLLSSGEACVLADGLDEILGADRRKAASAALGELAAAYPRSQVIVFSRPDGYRSCPLDPGIFREGMLAPWTDARVRQYLENVVAMVDRSPSEAASLWEIFSRETAADSRSPRMLAMMVHRYFSTDRDNQRE